MRKTYHVNLSYKRELESFHLNKFDANLTKSFGVQIMRTLITVKPDLEENKTPFQDPLVILDLKNSEMNHFMT